MGEGGQSPASRVERFEVADDEAVNRRKVYARGGRGVDVNWVLWRRKVHTARVFVGTQCVGKWS